MIGSVLQELCVVCIFASVLREAAVLNGDVKGSFVKDGIVLKELLSDIGAFGMVVFLFVYLRPLF